MGGVTSHQAGSAGANRSLSNLLNTAINEPHVFNPGADIDCELIHVGVTGIPKLQWDESEDSFELTRSLLTPGVGNFAGDFKIQPGAGGDVHLFGDVDVDDADSGRMLYVNRKAAEGNDYIRMYISATQQGFLHTSCPLSMQGQVDLTINSVTEDVRLQVGDDAGVKKIRLRNASGADIGTVDSLGKAWFSNQVDTLKVRNSAGDLKLQPNAEGDIHLFGDADVGDADIGKYFYIHRKAAEGDTFLRLNLNSVGTGFISSSAGMILQGALGVNLISLNNHINLQLGDDAGVMKAWVKDSNAVTVASIDSLGTAWFKGGLGVGMVPIDDLLHVAGDDPAVLLENEQTAVGGDAIIGEFTVRGGEAQPSNLDEVGSIKVIATENWTGTSSPTRMGFHTTAVGAVKETERMTIDEAGQVGIGTSNPTRTLDVNGRLVVNDGITYVDESSYYGATNDRNILITNSTQSALAALNVNLGFTNSVIDLAALRSASSSYWLLRAWTGDGSVESFDEAVFGIRGDGNVGIGTTSPTEKLDVNGNVTITGSLTVDGGIANQEFFISAGEAILSSNASYDTPNDTYALSLADAVTFARCFFTFTLPADFSSMASGYPKVVFMQGTGGEGNYRIQFNARAGGVGEQIGANLDTIAEYTMAAPGLSSELWEEDVSACFDGLSLSAGDYVGLQIQRDSDDAADTFSGDLDVVGLVVKYS